MSSLNAMIAADALAIATEHGADFTYHSPGNADVAFKGFVTAGEVSPIGADGRRKQRNRITVAVPKSTVAAPRRQKDSITVPGYLVEKSTDQQLMVQNIDTERSDPGFWFLEVA